MADPAPALYGNGDGSYTVKDTEDRIHGECSFVDNRQELDCGSPFGPYLGLEALNCKHYFVLASRCSHLVRLIISQATPPTHLFEWILRAKSSATRPFRGNIR